MTDLDKLKAPPMTDVETVALREELARAAFAASWGVIDPDGLAPNYGRGGYKTQCLEWQAVADAILPLIARERAAALAARAAQEKEQDA